jgi:prepilin-type processing-associated H-X9-DG protein
VSEWTYFLHYMLPYLEQQAYYDALRGPRFDVENPWRNAASWPSTLNGATIPMVLCPSDGMGGDFSKKCPPCVLPKSNYLCIFSGLKDGDNWDNSTDYYKPCIQTQVAAFRADKGVSFSEIKDGTSNTMAVAEYLKGPDDASYRGFCYTNRAGCKFLYVTTGPNSPADDNLFSYDHFCGSSDDQPEQNLPCTPGGGEANFATPRSRHPGGVNAVFCDGSVHFIQDSINLTPWRSLGWIDDGSVPSGDY